MYAVVFIAGVWVGSILTVGTLILFSINKGDDQ